MTKIYIVWSTYEISGGPHVDGVSGIFADKKSAEAELNKAKKEDPYDYHEICMYELNDQGEYKIVKGETE